MRIARRPAVLLVTALFALACGPAQHQTPGTELVKSSALRQAPSAQGQADVPELAQGNTAFAFDLYRQLDGAQGNLFLSPYSISLALAMTDAGARANTATELAAALHFTLPPERLHPAFNALDQALESRAHQNQTDDHRGFELHLANTLFGEKSHTFEGAFLDLLAENYGAGMELVDFEHAPDAARLAINQWVSDQTNAKIKDLLGPGTVDAATVLVLVNAVYFDAAWSQPFDPASTSSGTFHRLDGSTVSASMMHEANELRYGHGDGWQAVELPYEGDQLSMLVVVPDSGKFADVESQLTSDSYGAIDASLSTAEVTLSMPKFSFTSRFDKLTQALSALGIHDAFSPGSADFSGMDGQKDLFVSDVVHQGFVAVDEKGTEAAAATAVLVAGSAAPSQVVTLDLDRPFFVVIRDNPTGTVLFLGRVVDPS